jgi:hypothetical protein
MAASWEEFKKRYADVIILMNQKLERLKKKLAQEKEPHCLEWWDGVMFDTFPGYVEKRSRQVYIRNFLKENDIQYTAVSCKE